MVTDVRISTNTLWETVRQATVLIKEELVG